jgi:hypothetical protein
VNRRITGEVARFDREDIERFMALLARMEETLDACPAVRESVIRRFLME